MKKNGFLAISVLYSFFLCFCILMVGLLANYTHQALIFEKSSSPLTYEKQNLYLEIILPAFFDYDLTALVDYYPDFSEDNIKVKNNNYYHITIPIDTANEVNINSIKTTMGRYDTETPGVRRSLFDERYFSSNGLGVAYRMSDGVVEGNIEGSVCNITTNDNYLTQNLNITIPKNSSSYSNTFVCDYSEAYMYFMVYYDEDRISMGGDLLANLPIDQQAIVGKIFPDSVNYKQELLFGDRIIVQDFIFADNEVKNYVGVEYENNKLYLFLKQPIVPKNTEVNYSSSSKKLFTLEYPRGVGEFGNIEAGKVVTVGLNTVRLIGFNFLSDRESVPYYYNKEDNRVTALEYEKDSKYSMTITLPYTVKTTDTIIIPRTNTGAPIGIILPESGQSSSCYNVALGAISGGTMTLGGKTFSGPWITISPKSNDLSGLYCTYYVADDNITQDGYVCTLYKDDECISWKYIGQV